MNNPITVPRIAIGADPSGSAPSDPIRRAHPVGDQGFGVDVEPPQTRAPRRDTSSDRAATPNRVGQQRLNTTGRGQIVNLIV